MNTPITDAAARYIDGFADQWVPRYVSEETERELTTVTKERDEAREQRDRLAAVLQSIRDGYGGQVAAPDCCEDCEFLIPIDEALQSLNQPEP